MNCNQMCLKTCWLIFKHILVAVQLHSPHTALCQNDVLSPLSHQSVHTYKEPPSPQRPAANLATSPLPSCFSYLPQCSQSRGSSVQLWWWKGGSWCVFKKKEGRGEVNNYFLMQYSFVPTLLPQQCFLRSGCAPFPNENMECRVGSSVSGKGWEVCTGEGTDISV